MGPFLESVKPDFKKYKQKWESADLSCVSVFHKSVISPLFFGLHKTDALQ